MKIFSLKHQGFTLIEITLTIVVISLLAAFVWVVIDPAKKLGDTKDARRLNDASIIKQAINEYVLDNQSWPTEISALATSTPYGIRPAGASAPGTIDCDDLLGTVTSTVALSLVPNYLASLPTDPEGDYYYLIRHPQEITVAPCSTYANSLDINNGLVSLWHFDESAWSGAAGEVKDWENSQHGVKSGTASTTPDAKLGAYGGFFNNGLITVGASATINPSNFSLGYWFKNSSDQTVGSVPRITSRTGNHFETAVANSYGAADNVSIYFYYGAWIDTTYDADPNEWHYYVWTYNGTTLKLYVDGVEEYSGSIAITISASDALYIGNTSGLGEGIIGNLDEVSLWNRALSQAEAAYLYNLQK